MSSSPNDYNKSLQDFHRKNLKRVQVSDDSDDDVDEIDSSKVAEIFKNYRGNKIDVVKITQFFESGENIDCLICE